MRADLELSQAGRVGLRLDDELDIRNGVISLFHLTLKYLVQSIFGCIFKLSRERGTVVSSYEGIKFRFGTNCSLVQVPIYVKGNGQSREMKSV